MPLRNREVGRGCSLKSPRRRWSRPLGLEWAEAFKAAGTTGATASGGKGLGGSKGWKEGRTGVDRERTARGTDGSGEIRGDYGRRWLGRDGDAGCRDRDRAEGGREEGRGGETEIMKGPTAAQERGTDE